MMTKKAHRKNQRGFTTIEMMFVIGVVVVGLTAIMTTLYRNAESNRLVTTFLTEQMQIEQGIREMYKAQMDYTALTYNQVLTAGLIPADLQWLGFRGKNQWGLAWGVYPGASTPTGTDFGQTIAFRIVLPDMATCETVGRQLAPRSQWMIEIIGNTTITLPPTIAAPRSASADMTAVDAACAVAFKSSAVATFSYATI